MENTFGTFWNFELLSRDLDLPLPATGLDNTYIEAYRQFLRGHRYGLSIKLSLFSC